MSISKNNEPKLLVKIAYETTEKELQRLKEYLGIEHFSNIAPSEAAFYLAVPGNFNFEELCKKFKNPNFSFSRS